MATLACHQNRAKRKPVALGGMPTRNLAEQGARADALQRPLVPRCGFEWRLTPSVGPQQATIFFGGGEENMRIFILILALLLASVFSVATLTCSAEGAPIWAYPVPSR